MRLRDGQVYYFVAGAISLGMSMLIHFNALFLLVFPGSFHSVEWNNIEPWTSVLANLITTTVITFCVFAVSAYFLKPMDGTGKAGLKSVAKSVFFTLIAALLLSEIFFNLNHLLTDDNSSDKNHLLYFIKDIFIALVVFTSVYLLKIFNEKKAMETENQRLKYDNLQSQYHSLKNQISPHFLFNSLTALRELVENEPEISAKYVNHLSQVLRYTLVNNEQRTVSLSDELKSLESYVFLLRIRFGGNLIIELNTNSLYLNHRLPPLVLQTLTENAVKHNEVSRRFPLKIRIYTTENGKLAVSNEIHPRLTHEPGTGLGLTNLTKQYELMQGGNVIITRSENEFRVEVPLLKPE